MREQKGRIARYRLVKGLHSFKEILSLASGVNESVVDEFFCSEVEIISGQVFGRSLLDGCFIFRRKFGLKLIGYSCGNLALDGKDIGQVAVVFLGPDMGVVAGIN